MNTVNKQIKDHLEKNKKEAQKFLSSLIKFRSLRGKERDIQLYLKERLDKLSFYDCRIVPISDDIKKDRDYVFDIPKLTYKGRPNLIVLRRGKGKGNSIILNAHVDVVLAEKWPKAFNPRIKNGIVYGRGACDNKGNIVVIFLALKTLEDLGLVLDGDIIAQFVIEEEVGSNGTLALIKKGYKADGAIVLEASDLNIYPAARGAVWFRIICEGKSAHSGIASVNAIEKAIEAIGILKKYRKKLALESKGNPLFKDYNSSTPLNIGIIRGGEWPSIVASQAIIEGLIGFLPNKRKEQVMEDLRRELKTKGTEWLRCHHQIEFPMLNKDAYEISVDDPLVKTMESSCKTVGVIPEIKGMTASCDAWLYKQRMKIPVIIFGAGSMRNTHCDNERIEIDQILKAAEILTIFLIKWCGRAK